MLSRHISHTKHILIACCLLVPLAVGATQSGPRDADSNAVVYNGAYTRAELTSKLKNGDGYHSGASLQKEFSSRGITVKSITSDNTVNGTVTKGGRVIVDGKTVATGAISYGREYMSGSTKEGNLYARPTSVSFKSSSLPAFVHMEDGRFKYAIIKSCGNMVKATPVPLKTSKKEAPKPVEKPVVIVQQTQIQSQAQAAPAPAPAPAPASAPTPAPAQLPETGAVGLMGLAGSTAIGGTLWQYRRSKQSLLKAQQDS